MDFNVENVFFFLLVQNVRMLFKEGQKCHAILWLTPSLRLKVHKILLVNISKLYIMYLVPPCDIWSNIKSII